MAKKVFWVAGEASADLHGAALLAQIQKVDPKIEVFGVGGSRLQKLGLRAIINAESLNVVGGLDWAEKATEIVRSYFRVKRSIGEQKPDLAVLMDLPDFNLKLAHHLKKAGVPIVYYISPQVWAWRKYRVKKIRKLVDRMLAVFPFEKEFYEKRGVACEYVGHPLVDHINPKQNHRSSEEILSCPRIALLPGSRKSEIKHHGPILREMLQRVATQYPDSEIRVPVARTLDPQQLKQVFQGFNVILEENTQRVFNDSDVAVVASGTATLEAALAEIPFFLFYRVNASSAFLFRTFSGYKGPIGMPNVLLRQRLVSEFFQEKATGENLFHCLDQMLNDKAQRTQLINGFQQCRRILGTGGASARAARAVLSQLEGS